LLQCTIICDCNSLCAFRFCSNAALKW